ILSLLAAGYLRCKTNFCAQRQLHWLFALSLLAIGFSYASLKINWRLQQLIQQPINKLTLQGYLTTPATLKNQNYQAEFSITHGALTGQKILLYYPVQEQLSTGKIYQFSANLQPLNLITNFAAFDYGQYLIAQNISASAFMLGSAELIKTSYAPSAQINRLRVNLINYLEQTLVGQKYAGLAIALVTGYQQFIPSTQWSIFKNSGIIHIVSISGLHITLIAMMAVFILSLILRYGLPPSKIPQQIILAWLGVAVALAYSLLAGFSIPTQRTFYLLLLMAYLITRRRHIPLLNKLSITLSIILILDPFACRNLGFWFSFSLVATIFAMQSAYQQHSSKLLFWLKLQLAMLLVSLPLTLFLFSSYPLIASIANLWAIPILGNLLTPLILISSLSHWSWLIQFSVQLLNYAMLPIEYLATISPYRQAQPDLITLLIAYLGVILILLPNAFKGKNYLGLIMFCVLFMVVPSQRPNYGETQIIAFSNPKAGFTLLQTQQHNLLIILSRDSQQLSKQLEYTVLPYLQAQHINQIDYLVINQPESDTITKLLQNQDITLLNQTLPDNINLDGVNLQLIQDHEQLALISQGHAEISYIGTGYQPFNQTHWDNVVIGLALAKLDWLFSAQLNNLLINYAKDDRATKALLDNINLPATQSYDLIERGSQKIKHTTVVEG
ncbi:MAG: ComEC/Rec2 family competence protein, partial [Burkholderiales bacterium]|nr:ComEC/Rec2 family competence protein [Burkholderiales bacterium]